MTVLASPLCNTGVHPPMAGHSSVFDWYRATVPASVELLASACLDLAGPSARVVNGKGRFNYLHSLTVEAHGDRVATILHGGSNGHPNVEASGQNAPALAAMLRAGGEHRVTRCDIAVDLHGDGLFKQLRRRAHRIARDNGIACREVRNPTDASKGETVYLGSRKSAVFARIYEKGKAERTAYLEDGEGVYGNGQASVYGNVPAEVLDSWVRVELEVKPQKEMKAVAARLEPHQFWGISAWTQRLAQEVLDMAADPIPFHPRRTASDERAFRFMCAQYRNLLRRRAADVHGGDRMALAREIVDLVFDDRASDAA